MFSDKIDRMVEVRSSTPPAWLALVVGMVVCAGVMIPLALRAPRTNFDNWSDGALVQLGMVALLASMAVTALVWFFVWFGYVRRTGREVADKYFAVLLATCLASVGGTLFYKHQLGAVDRSVAAMEVQWDSTQRRDFDRYVTEINALSLREVLRAEVLARPGAVAGAREKLARAEALIEKHRGYRPQRIAAYRAKIEALKVDAATRARLLKTFAEQRRQTELAWQNYFDSQQEMVVASHRLVDFLDRRRGTWTMRGLTIVFGSRADLNAFDAIVAAYDAAYDRQERLALQIPANQLFRTGTDYSGPLNAVRAAQR